MAHAKEGDEPGMDTRIKAIRLEKWREIIIACNTSGMKKKEWMELHNLNSKSFYRKQKELREYEMEKAGITSAETSAGKNAAEFFDLTQALTRQTKEIPVATGMRKDRCVIRMEHPELVIQAGEYHLYIGNGITEATLATVLRVISRA